MVTHNDFGNKKKTKVTLSSTSQTVKVKTESDLIAGNVLNVGNLQIHARFRNSQLFTQNLILKFICKILW